MDDFIWRALLAGFGVALMTGPLGAFVVWRRMAYFGAALSHSALLGVVLGLLLGLDPFWGVLAVCLGVAVTLSFFREGRGIPGDSLLGIIAHGALALGLIAAVFLGNARFDLMAVLFGDILAVSWGDIAWIYGIGGSVLMALAFLWTPLLSMTLHEELAAVEGTPVAAVRLAFMVLLALAVAVAMKVVGLLLVTSMLIIPAASARPFSATPERMALGAAVVGCLAVAGGLWGAFSADLPAGPAIVVAAVLMFAASRVVRARR